MQLVPNDIPGPSPAEAAAPDRWYHARGDTPAGPVTFAALQALAASGALQPGDRVWTPQHPEWALAESVAGLLDGGLPVRRPARASPLAVASDALPLLILAGIILCFLVYFGRAVPATPHAAKLLDRAPDAGAQTFVAEAAGDDTYAVEICNNTKEGRLYAAVAFFDPLRNDWVARGWFAEDQGACQTAVKNVRAPVYVYAETKDGASRWADEAGGREFCLESHVAFAVAQADCNAMTGSRLRREKFKLLKVSGQGGVHTWDLTE